MQRRRKARGWNVVGRRRRYAGRRRRSVGSRLAAKAKAAEAMVVAARSMEVVMEVKGTAVMVAAEEEAAKGESAVAEVRRCRDLGEPAA